MKFHQEFRVSEKVEKVWAFFDQPLQVAQCIPGVKQAELIDADNVSIVVTQKLGPMSATFDAKVNITNRVHQERIEFTSTGKAVRGAIGNFRASNSVVLTPEGEHTLVVVGGEVALAGALGSVGQKVISKQAEKVTIEFTKNLEQILSGKEVVAPSSLNSSATSTFGNAVKVGAGAAESDKPLDPAFRPDRWARLSAGLSAASLIVSLIVLWHVV